ncbi:MAG: efflux RND transporter permease subunit [Acidobacteria bacterium]|nr:efflux RND transporter permease subunit [Acidobacteriota bacterium]
MNFSEIFIRRPIATILMMAGIAMFGILAYWALPVSDLPAVDFPTLTVSASLPGADPQTMSSSVATPLERQFTTIAGIDSMTSTSSLGSTSITIQFDLDRKIDGAAVDVQTAISAAMPLLPPGMPNPPSFRKMNPSDGPVMMFALTSPTAPLWEVNEYADRTLGQRISMINGVAQVNVMGAQKYAVRIQVDPEKLAARKIGLNEVAAAVRNWNVNVPTGTLWGEHQAFNVMSNGQLPRAKDYQDLVVTWRNGAPVRLADLATVRDGSEDERTSAWTYGSLGLGKALNLMVMRQPGSNVIEVNDTIRDVMPQLQKQMPPNMKLEIRSDRSKNIREAFNDVKLTLLLTLGLVIMVIAIFLRRASATLIPSLALPFSLVGTFAVMWLLNYSLDNLSMMAIILCVGFVVDDAIVMLENIVRHMEKGEGPLEAALKGSKEIWSTIVSMTISLAAVFIPILFMGGILGRLFREFAVTICVAVLISGFVSVTLTPMLCSRLLKPDPVGHRPNPLSRLIEWFLNGFTRWYEVSLGWVLNHRPVMLLVFAAVIGATGYLYELVPKGFIPESDTDSIQGGTEMQVGTSFEAMKLQQQRVINVVRTDPDIEGFMTSVGGNMMGGTANTGRFFIQLKPRRERQASAQDIVTRLRPKLGVIPGVRTTLSVPPAIRIGGRGSRSSYELTLQSSDTAALYREAAKFEREVAKLPSILDVNSDAQARTPRIRIDVDRDKAAVYGINAQDIEQNLYNGYGSSFVSTIYAPTNQYRVMLEVLPKFQNFSDNLSKIYLKGSGDQMVPLEAVTKRVEDVGPQSIAHTGQLPSVTISFNLKPGVALSQAVDEVSELALEKLPSTINTVFTGTAKVFQDSLKNLGLLLLIAILVVYIVLGVLYESFIHPVTILSGLPAAAFGALLTLQIFGMELNIYGFVGLILLIGLVKKNAIMQIDFALDLQRHGRSAKEAIHEGCLARFRPIMMTTMAALLGTLPIASGYGAGGEARKPLGLCVVGGLLFSQAITLYLTPVIYTYFDGLVSRKRGKLALPVAPAPELTPIEGRG